MVNRCVGRIGLGVNLEYARMANQSVTDELQARADEFGITFDHPGLTLGTVLHNINLKGAMERLLRRTIVRNLDFNPDLEIGYLFTGRFIHLYDLN